MIQAFSGRPVVRASAAYSHSGAITASGRVYTWGSAATGKVRLSHRTLSTRDRGLTALTDRPLFYVVLNVLRDGGLTALTDRPLFYSVLKMLGDGGLTALTGCPLFYLVLKMLGDRGLTTLTDHPLFY